MDGFRDDRATLTIDVVDSGEGIPPECADTIFEAFTQVDSSAARRHEGAGLGLAISRRLAEFMGGDLSVESEPGRGSVFTFTVRLDIAESRRRNPEGGGAQTPPEPAGGLRVLVAEDEPLNAEVVRRMLESAGHAVTAVKDGRQAVEAALAPHARFDLIVMDVMMPGLSGVDATIAIRGCGDETRAAVPIVALTASATHEDRERCLDAGMSAYATKPLTRDQLIRVANETVSLERGRRRAAAGQSRPWNHQRLVAVCGDGATAQRLLSRFVDLQQEYLSDIAAACEARDFDRVARTSHRLKGALATLHAEPARVATERLELSARGRYGWPEVESSLRRVTGVVAELAAEARDRVASAAGEATPSGGAPSARGPRSR